MKLPILVDLDGVLFDFVDGFYSIAMEKYPNLYAILPDIVTTFYIEESIDQTLLTRELRRQAYAIVDDKDLFRRLSLIENAVAGNNYLKELSGREVKFVSAPHCSNFNSYSQKAESIHDKFGRQWVDNLILTRDKSLVSGIVLIDDKPLPMGSYKENWEHIVFDRSYNMTQSEVKGKYRMFGWSNSEVERLVEYINQKGDK